MAPKNRQGSLSRSPMSKTRVMAWHIHNRTPRFKRRVAPEARGAGPARALERQGLAGVHEVGTRSLRRTPRNVIYASSLAPGRSAYCKEDDDLSPDAHAAPAASTGPRPDPQMTSEDLLKVVIDSLEDDKAEDIVTIDLRGRSEMGDFMVIASGRSTRQVAAIAEKLADRLKQDHGILSKTEGKETADWVLIDTGDVIVHVFRPEVRDFYQLEKMWLPAGTAARSAAG